ncbi:MAG: hypothetical protein PVF05_10715 [Gemmatimonadales bacterium]|jgi:hypothetical protein
MDDLIPIVAIFFVIGVPVMSIATHFVLRPLVRDIVGALRGGSREEMDVLRNQITELHEELARHENQLHVLTEAEAFRRQLEAKKDR